MISPTRFFLILSFSFSTAWARVCSLDEIRRIDSAYLGQQLSSYPQMTKVAGISPIIAYVPQQDKPEDPAFWTASFIGALGSLYFYMKNRNVADCEDPDLSSPNNSRRRYSPTGQELYSYHQKQRAIFWETYTWTAVWTAGILLTTDYDQKKTAAMFGLILPWSYAFSGRWTPWTEDSQMQYMFYPDKNGDSTVAIFFSF